MYLEYSLNSNEIVDLFDNRIFKPTKLWVSMCYEPYITLRYIYNNININIEYNKLTKWIKITFKGKLESILILDKTIELLKSHNISVNSINNDNEITITCSSYFEDISLVWLLFYNLTKYNKYQLTILSFLIINDRNKNILVKPETVNNTFYYIYQHKCNNCIGDNCEHTQSIGWVAMDNNIYYIYIHDNEYVEFIDKANYRTMLENMN